MAEVEAVIPEPCVIKHNDAASALVGIVEDLPGIEKRRHEGGVTYKYRGIEEITVALQPLLVKHGVVITPSVELLSVVELPHKGTKGDWTRTTVRITYTIHLRGSDSTIVAATLGVGDDNADKGGNKAATQAFKYLLLQTFCISDPADDGDGIAVDGGGQPAQVDEEPSAPEGWNDAKASAKAHSEISERVSKLTDEQRAVCSEWRKSNPGWPLSKEKFDELSGVVALLESGVADAPPADVVVEDDASGDGF